jgi:POLQ-like helicase
MYEYRVPFEYHIQVQHDPAHLFPLSIGLLGDMAAEINSVDINEVEQNRVIEARENLQFSAHFFDAYLQSKLDQDIEQYLLLLGATAYYLCDLPGSSAVLAKRIKQDELSNETIGLEQLLLWLLKFMDSNNQLDDIPLLLEGIYRTTISEIATYFKNYYSNGGNITAIIDSCNMLRKLAYENGTPRQLLFADIVCALVRKRIQNSTWFCLPKYSNLFIDNWKPTLQKNSFIRELWPAQHLLGRHSVFQGRSAVIQMPTSAGKTKATEIIIRSAFISHRASTVVIVVPFRALCHEIRDSLSASFQNENINIDEFSDIPQLDFELRSNLEEKQVWIATPEKLLYMLRHLPELASQIGLLIYDEGHQFDNGTRGVTYELLLTSLKALISSSAQIILISAVIRNAEQIKEWLTNQNSEVISGINLTPTYRTLAFTSWKTILGRLEFVSPDNPNEQEFFVPRAIESQELTLKPRETSKRFFPEKNDSSSIALYLGLKLSFNGSVAIFCGTKLSAVSCCKKVVDAYSRNLSIPQPSTFSNQEELQRLSALHSLNLGDQAIVTQSAKIGVFAHHNNMPHGIRLAVEYALKENLIKFVICTSTLAQGVNLPLEPI